LEFGSSALVAEIYVSETSIKVLLGIEFINSGRCFEEKIGVGS
jgi:hypothetical protein